MGILLLVFERGIKKKSLIDPILLDDNGQAIKTYEVGTDGGGIYCHLKLLVLTMMLI